MICSGVQLLPKVKKIYDNGFFDVDIQFFFVWWHTWNNNKITDLGVNDMLEW